MSHKPIWKECVSAAIHTGMRAAAAFVPGATLVTDFCDKIVSTREAESRHDEIVTRIGAIEQAVRGAFSQVCQRMTQPGLSLDQLDAIMHDLFEMRQANREPFLSQGMFANCVLYPDLLKNPNRYGRVLDYNTTLQIEEEAFYIFLDIDKTRLLKMSHGQTMSLLAGQLTGIPASEVIGRANFFAQRTDSLAITAPIPAQIESPPSRPIIVPGDTDVIPPPLQSPHPQAQVIARPQIPSLQPRVHVNSLKMKLVRIEPGQFHCKSEQQVKITKPFYIGITPMTQAQWKAVMGTDPSCFKGADRPVERVSWPDATHFCEKLGKQEGKRYRVPTEAEWEYACRAGTQTEYNTGDSENALAEAGWYANNSGNETHPVGQKKANAWGLYDMHGNVWEWCYDIFHTGYASNARRVLRGGAWFHDPHHCRSACRNNEELHAQSHVIGFRVVLDSA